MFRTLGSIFILFFAFHLHLEGQQWEINLPSQVLIGATDLTLTEAEDIIIVGANVSSGPGRAVRMSPEGKIRWNTELSNLPLHQMVPLPNGRYAAFGWRIVSNSAWVSFVEFDNQGRKTQEYTNKIDSLYFLRLVNVFPAADGGFLLAGYHLEDGSSQGNHDFFLARANNTGEIQWIRSIDISDKDWSFSAQETPDGNFLLTGLIQVDGSDQPFMLKLDREGQELWRSQESGIGLSFPTAVILNEQRGIALSYYNYNSTYSRFWLVHFDLATGATLQTYRLDDMGIRPQSALLDEDGTIVLSGTHELSSSPYRSRLGMARVTTEGELIWDRYYGQLTGQQVSHELLRLPDGGFLIGGQQLGANSSAYLVKTDALGYSRTNVIRGRVVQAPCELSPEGPAQQNWLVEVRSETDTLYGLSDASGAYEVRVDSGTFAVELFPPNIYWSACQPLQTVALTGTFDTLTVDFPVQVAYDCPLLRVDVSTPLLRRCYENTYYIDYCNEGTATAPNAYLEVELDPFFIPESSTPEWTGRAGQLLKFELGDVPPGVCRQVQINGRLDCEQTQVGQSHCIQAKIFPDSLCTPPGINWDGSSIELSGKCIGDSIEFLIQNVGIGDMLEELQYVVIEDLIIHRSGYFQLGADESLRVTAPATGATYRLEADQAEGHPGSSRPSSTVEGCRLNGLVFSQGVLTQFPFDEGDPFIAIDCQENIGSWDPNDIRVFPKGMGPDHLIDRETELEYHIRFQNTGTDTAFQVQILDTLPLPQLDLSSLKIGSSSHPFTWELSSTGIISFRFEGIALPDSSTNEMASHGFVRFKIHPQVDILPGTTIANRAAIYFDFNEAVITNTATVTIRKPVSYRSIEDQTCSPDVDQPEHLAIVDTLMYPELDSILIYNVEWLPQHEFSVDTLIPSGGVVQGITWFQSGSLRDSLLNQWGCDSLILFHIEVDSTVTNTHQPPEEDLYLKVYPNPSTGSFQLEYFLKQATVVSARLVDTWGRTVSSLSSPTPVSPGLHRVRWPLAELPPGLYWLRLEVVGQVPQLSRLMIY